MNRSLSISSIDSSSRGKEGGGDQQMSPELLNKVFQRNPHNTCIEIAMKA
jgi:hypothetical protein